MTPAIEVRHLSYRYPDGRQALLDVSFTIAEGECVGVVGPNGAGKSTLLLHLNGILPERPQDGESRVRIFGQTDPAARRRAVGLLFQDPDDQLFCPTVLEDVSFGPQQLGLPSSVVSDALAAVGLIGYENRAPHHLSHGEKRRVCLAAVLACQPRILALDEPTSGLDPRGRRELKALLHKVRATKVLASHDLDLVAEFCSRVLVLDAGKLVADGPAVEILGDVSLMLAHGLERPHWLMHRHPHQTAH
ncbi:MAG: energy-coupling factor ABC transporter ATP-binding protein [Verrucomicrobiae bacterium]|nr:energy-coupling factor ABC transporter ATP-binding protein [Verrucomicrobiae bacterium]